MDGPRYCHIELSKSDREREISYDLRCGIKKKVKLLETQSRTMVTRGWGAWKMGRLWSKVTRLQLTPGRMVIIEKTRSNKCCRRCREKGTQ